MKAEMYKWIELNLIAIQIGALRAILKDDPDNQEAVDKFANLQTEGRELLNQINAE